MEVKIYSTQTCPYCHRVKDYLKSKNIPYQNLDVGIDPAAREEMVKLSGQMGVPVVTIDGNLVIGFDKEKIDSFLGL